MMGEIVLPQGWIKAKISDAIQPRGEKVNPSDYPDSPFLGMDHVEAQTTRIIGSIPASTMKSNASRFFAGDVLYGRLRPYLNKVAQPQFSGLASAEFIVFPDTDFIASNFLKYRLNAGDFVSFASHLNEGDRPRVSFEQIGDFEVLIPPLAEQHRIVAKIEELFSELDQGIESLRTAHEQLKVYRQVLLKHAFEGKLTAKWRVESKERVGAQFIASASETNQGTMNRASTKCSKTLPPLTADELANLPKLPEGWRWCKVGQLCDVVRGGSPRPAGDPKFYGGDIPFLKVADITRNNSPYLNSFTYTIKEAGLSKTRHIFPHTLLLSNSGATLGVPKICLLSATMNDGVAAFLGLPKEFLLYHYYFWQSRTEQLRNIDQGAAQPNLNTDLIKETFIPICSLDEQLIVIQRLEAALSEVDQLDQTIATALQQSETLRQAILKKAFSGRLVPQDPRDESASLLLERIKAEKCVGQKSVKKKTGKVGRPRKVALAGK